MYLNDVCNLRNFDNCKEGVKLHKKIYSSLILFKYSFLIESVIIIGIESLIGIFFK